MIFSKRADKIFFDTIFSFYSTGHGDVHCRRFKLYFFGKNVVFLVTNFRANFWKTSKFTLLLS